MKILAIVLVAVCCGLVGGPPSWAQEWSPAQKEVWQQIEDFWARDAAKDLASVMAHVHEDYVGWDITESMTTDKARLAKYLDHRYKSNVTIPIQDIEPVAINVFGDVAVVYYNFGYLEKDAKGEEKFESGRWAEVLLKQDGKWLLIGDHGGVTSSEE
jgi:ketosteroid isomerase-like protein